MNYFRKLNSRGDTIVEVLIVLAVLGLALSISYATANRGLQQSRNAQEHSEALGIINSQVEILRSAYAKQAGGSFPAGPTAFCVATSSTAPVSVQNIGTGFDEDIAHDVLDASVYHSCNQNSFYNVSIVKKADPANPSAFTYDFRVRWDGIGKLGKQQEELTYRIDSVAFSGGYRDPEVPVIPAPPPPPPPAPTPTITLNSFSGPPSVQAGSSVSLNWSATANPSGASITCKESGAWSNTKGASGQDTASTFRGSYAKPLTFNLTCSSPGYISASGSVSVSMTSTYVPFYRFYSDANTDHFYSQADPISIAVLASWGYENQGAISKIDTVQGPGEIPLYSQWNANARDHFYTTDANETIGALYFGYDWPAVYGYVFPTEGYGCPAATPGLGWLFRMYSSYYTDHFYTTSGTEFNGGYGIDAIHNPPLFIYSFENVTGCVYPN